MPEGRVVVERAATPSELGRSLNRTAADVVRFAMQQGEMVTATQPLPDDLIERFASEVGADVAVVANGSEVTATGREVDCTVFAPPTVEAGRPAMVQVFFHPPDDAGEAAARAAEFDADAARRATAALSLPLRTGMAVSVHLRLPGFEVPTPLQELRWRDRVDAVTFDVVAPPELAPGPHVGTVVLSVGPTPVGRLCLRLDVSPAGASGPVGRAALPVTTAAAPFRRAFASYSHHDRVEVMKRLQGVRAVGVDFRLDVLNLEPGERWRERVADFIDECDVFLLFWSRAASDSAAVRDELAMALRRRGDDPAGPPTIEPLILDGPPPPPPPPELADDQHFNDVLLYLH